MALSFAVLAMICIALIHSAYAVPPSSIQKADDIDVNSLIHQAVDPVVEPSDLPVADPEDPVEADRPRRRKPKTNFFDVYKW